VTADNPNRANPFLSILPEWNPELRHPHRAAVGPVPVGQPESQPEERPMA
jgi:hypothetical protein